MNESHPRPETADRLLSRRIVLQLSLILLTGLLAYSNSLNGPFHFDDLGISEKSILWPRAFRSGPRQLVDLTFVMNHVLNGNNVFGYHVFNLIIHLVASVTLFALAASALTALTISFPAKSPAGMKFAHAFIPFTTALLFVCHPVQTQAVSYIVQRYAAMAALFYFASVLFFIRMRIAMFRQHSGPRVWYMACLTALMCVLAFRCKETAYTLPFMLLSAELFIFRGSLLKNRFVMRGLISCILLALAAAWIARYRYGGFEDLLYRLQHGTREELTYSRIEYLQTQMRVIVSYLRLLILPVNQNLDYDIPLQKQLLSLPVLASAALHTTALTASALLFLRSRRHLLIGTQTSGACLRLTSFGIIWFYLSLAVESSIIPILDVMFEHRLYLPSGGAFLAIAAASVALISSKRSMQTAAWTCLAVVCCVLTVTTFQRNRVWSDDLLLWEDTARKSPNKPRVLANLAAVYLRNGKPEKALPPLIRALEMAPGLTDPLNYLGSALDMLKIYDGRYDNGQRYIEGVRSINMRYYNKWFANTRNNLGLVYEHIGNSAMALTYYEQAVTLDPTFEEAWYNLFLMANRLNRQPQAEAAYKRLHEINPERAVYARSLTGKR